MVGAMIDQDIETDLHKVWSYLDFILGEYFGGNEE